MALNYIKWAGMALWPQKPEMLAATSSWDETLMVISTKASRPRCLGTMPHGTQISYIKVFLAQAEADKMTEILAVQPETVAGTLKDVRSVLRMSQEAVPQISPMPCWSMRRQALVSILS
jgi:hypothetical protein